MNDKQHPATRYPLLIILALALTLRIIILACNAVPFNSDEAVVALMARHTLQGEWPIFFYGQSYMGSLDASLIAAGFALLGQSVLVIRLVQTALYLGIIASTYLLGLRFYASRWTAGAAALLLALPTVLVSTYTTATLGGYGEILLLGNLVLLWGHRAATERPDDWRLWARLGAAAGLGFWTSALIVTYLLPVGVLVLVKGFKGRPWRGWLVATGAFLLFSSPWWWHNLTHDWSAMRFVLTGEEQTGIGIGTVSFGTRLAGMALLGLPALLGMRFPWSADYLILPLAVGALLVYGVAFLTALRSLRRAAHSGQMLLVGVAGTFAILFLFSGFGTDATGRYFLPLVVPLALWTGNLLGHIRLSNRRLALVTGALLLGFNLLGNGMALAQNPPGLTTQFDASNRFDNAHDQELITFLRQIGVTHGYSNYFVVFRIAFISQQEIILSSQLPYKPDLSYNPADDRYPSYTAEVEGASQIVYITSIHPTLDTVLAERFAQAGISFEEKQIGPYHVFFKLSRHVRPQEIGFGHP